VKFFVVDADARGTYRYAADGQVLAKSALNKTDSKPPGIASNATGTTQWVVDAGGDVFVYDNTGRSLGQWAPQNIGKPEGIAVWGSNLWVVDPTTDRVYFFAGGANLRSGRINPTSSFALNGGNLNATDVVTDGSHLWVVNDTVGVDSVFRYSTTGALEGSWQLDSTNPSPTGITLDPNSVGHLWIVDASTDSVYQYDNATSRTSGSQTVSATFPLAAGNTNPQGIADPLPIAALPAIAVSEPTKTKTAQSEDIQWRAAVDQLLAQTSLDKGVATVSSVNDKVAGHARSHRQVRDHDDHAAVDALFASLWGDDR
jgi:hypothetical protein